MSRWFPVAALWVSFALMVVLVTVQVAAVERALEKAETNVELLEHLVGTANALPESHAIAHTDHVHAEADAPESHEHSHSHVVVHAHPSDDAHGDPIPEDIPATTTPPVTPTETTLLDTLAPDTTTTTTTLPADVHAHVVDHSHDHDHIVVVVPDPGILIGGRSVPDTVPPTTFVGTSP